MLLALMPLLSWLRMKNRPVIHGLQVAKHMPKLVDVDSMLLTLTALLDGF